MLYTIEISWPSNRREQKTLIEFAADHLCFIDNGVVKGDSMEEIMTFGRAHFTDMTEEQITDLVVIRES